MRNQSKKEILQGNLAPIQVYPGFPVSEPDFNTRGDIPIIEPHIHNLCEIGYCFSGTGVFLVANKVLNFKSGDAVFITSQEFHQALGSPGQKTSWGFLNFDPNGLIPFVPENPSIQSILDRCCGNGFRNIIDGVKHPEITSCIKEILLERRDMPVNWKPMVRAGIWKLMLFLERICPQKVGSEFGNYNDILRIIPALNLMNAHFDRKITLNELASSCSTSVPNFRKLFYKAMGIVPYPYLSQLRIRFACSQLENLENSISRIAELAGFNVMCNFNRQFKEIMGISPSQYRKQINVKTNTSE